MNRSPAIVLAAALLLASGCSQKTAQNAGGEAPSPAPAATAPDTASPAPAPATSQLLAKSLYDDGPRAAAGPVNAAMAAAGEKLFTTKGCMACHAYGKKMTGPDLKGVTKQRTAEWMENQIMHPDVMTRTDPISHGLMVENNNLQMLNLHLTETEARSLIEYFKKLDKSGK